MTGRKLSGTPVEDLELLASSDPEETVTSNSSNDRDGPGQEGGVDPSPR